LKSPLSQDPDSHPGRQTEGMPAGAPWRRLDMRSYVVLSVWWGCNNQCVICMLTGLRDRLKPLDFDAYKKIVIDIVNQARYRNLILSGSEVTTFDHLEAFVRYAASFGWFQKIQIQTNGRRLKDPGYARRLVEAGVNEFFVSIHGLGATHDTVTSVPGSFDEVWAGLREISGLGVNVVTNTVLNRLNAPRIPALMEALCDTGASEHHLWNYFPMEETDTKDLVVPVTQFAGMLRELLRIHREAEKPLVLKSFPQCLSKGPPGFFDSWFPVTVLPDVFWEKFARSGWGYCVHRDKCRARECWGLSRAHVKRFGDARELLSPMG